MALALRVLQATGLGDEAPVADQVGDGPDIDLQPQLNPGRQGCGMLAGVMRRPAACAAAGCSRCAGWVALAYHERYTGLVR